MTKAYLSMRELYVAAGVPEGADIRKVEWDGPGLAITFDAPAQEDADA